MVLEQFSEMIIAMASYRSLKNEEVSGEDSNSSGPDTGRTFTPRPRWKAGMAGFLAGIATSTLPLMLGFHALPFKEMALMSELPFMCG